MATPGRGGFGDPYTEGVGFGDPHGEDPGFGDPYIAAEEGAEDMRGTPREPIFPAVAHATAAEYRDAWILLLPPGPLWDTEIDADLFNLAEGLTLETARVSDQVEKIIVECNPCTTDEMLPEWEEVFGLPDDCAPENGSEDARKAAVRARFLAQGGQTPAYYLHLLEEVFGITGGYIEEGYWTPFTTGGGPRPPWSGSVVGDRIWDYSRWFWWRLNIPGNQVADQDMADQIECLFDRVRPAQTIVVFNYF